jgi:hypothetical protein
MVSKALIVHFFAYRIAALGANQTRIIECSQEHPGGYSTQGKLVKTLSMCM